MFSVTHCLVESLYGDIDFSLSISRHRFERLCSKLFDRVLTIVDKALEDANLERADVHEVLLVGGATRVLKLQHLLQDAFVGSKFIKSINPDEAAACGAALLASDMIGERSLMIQEVAPLSVNLVTSSGAIKTLIERNMKIPAKKSVKFTIPLNHRCEILLRVYESGHATANANNFLGEFQVLDIAPSRRRSHQIEVTFAIDRNGVPNVSAVDISSGKEFDVHARHTGHLSQEQMEQMMNEAKKLKEENERQRRKMAARNELEDRIFTTQMELQNEEIRRKISEKSRKKILSTCEATLKWIETDEEATEEDYQEMLKKVKSERSRNGAAKKNGWRALIYERVHQHTHSPLTTSMAVDTLSPLPNASALTDVPSQTLLYPLGNASRTSVAMAGENVGVGVDPWEPTETALSAFELVVVVFDGCGILVIQPVDSAGSSLLGVDY
ncbi:unnamed protein product [Taenia asiatica]|uniref:Heat shock 70 kDa protein 14 n=1 Tax=Taenia asiatica TaxID=60517 RepID=A0A0R3VTX6_TAEAS|nr:unnamed protein product [Taenia asiatica]